MITIRKSTLADLDEIMRCYVAAKRYMRATGNLNQWVNGYPSRELVADDIRKGVSYVGEDDCGEIVMTFAFLIGDDPTYQLIEDGEWLDDSPYCTIHRLGSTGKHKNVFQACVEFCEHLIDNIRLDTHKDNHTMQHAAERLGFKKCGIIYCTDSTPRIAYQRHNLTSKLRS